MALRAFALLLASFLPAASGAVVTGVSIVGGSLAGGSLLRVFGSGFDGTIATGATTPKVFVGVNECAVISYYSSDSQLTCVTPPAPKDASGAPVPGPQPVAVSLGVLNGQSAFVATPGGALSFTYSAASTPSLSLLGGGGAAGKQFVAWGALLDGRLSDYAVSVAGSSCELVDELYANPAAIAASGSGWVGLRCLLGDVPVGRWNVSLAAIEGTGQTYGFGAASVSAQALQVSAAGDIFQFTAHPRVTGLSQFSSGAGGGGALVITGTGFSTAPGGNAVWLGGGATRGGGSTGAGQARCAVTAASATRIVCTVPPAPQGGGGGGGVRPAGRGLLHEVWLEGDGATSLAALAKPPSFVTTATGVFTGYFFDERSTSNYAQRLSGFFVPPVSAFYAFYVDADDTAVLSLSANASAPAAARVVATVSSYTSSFYQRPAQISAPVWLAAGAPYWTTLVHAQSGKGSDHVFVGVRVFAGLVQNASAGGAPAPGVNADVAALQSPAQRALASVPTVQTVSLTVAVVRQVQLLTVAAAHPSGFFVVYWPYTTSPPVALRANASAAQVKAALAAHPAAVACGTDAISVARAAFNSSTTGAPGWAWTVTLGCASAAPWPAILIENAGMRPLPGFAAAELSSATTVQPSQPLGGSFALSVDGGSVFTPPLAAAVNAAAVQAALQALPGAGTVTVLSASANGDGARFIVAFSDGPFSLSAATLTVDASALSGASAAASVAVVQQGSTDPFYAPAPLDFFRTPLAAEPVTVVADGILSDCDVWAHGVNGSAACSFAFANASSAPTLADAAPGAVTAGAVLRLSGSGFLAAGASPVVRFNGAPACASVNVVNDTRLDCIVGALSAGAYNVSLLVSDVAGLALPALPGAPPPVVIYTQTVSALAPVSGSSAGGTLLTVQGAGFRGAGAAVADVVTVGGAPCVMQPGATPAALTCTTAAAAVGSAPVVVNGAAAGNFSFVAAPAVASLAPSRLPAGITGVLALQLTGVPASASGTNITVAVGARACAVNAVAWTAGGTAAALNCTLVRGAARAMPQTPLSPTVTLAGFGLATSNVTLDDGFRVASITPAVGSLAGGTTVTLTGTGFAWATSAAKAAVFLQWTDAGWGNSFSAPCPVIAAAPDGSSVTCVVPPVPPAQRGNTALWNATSSLTATLSLRVNNVSATCAAATAGCAFTQTAAATPVISGAALAPNAAAPSGLALVLAGSGLNLAGLAVTAGGLACPAAGAPTATSLTCLLPIGPAGTATLAAAATAGAATVADAAAANVSFPFWLAPAAAPLSGSAAGGLVVDIVGAGFPAVPANAVVAFGGVAAAVVSGNASFLRVLAPPTALALPATVPITVNCSAPGLPLLTLSATMTYNASRTPALASAAPAAGAAGTVLVLRGAGFSPVTQVLIGGVNCAVTQRNSTALTCVVGAAPAGTHRVLVYDPAVGLAAAAAPPPRFTLPAVITSVSPAVLGFGGGQLVTIAGSGFAATGLGANTVQLCNTACAVVAASDSALTCVTAPQLTRTSLANFSVWDVATLVAPAPAAITPAAGVAAFDGDIGTTFSSCTVGFDLGPDTVAIVTGLSAYPAFRKTAAMAGAAFEGSLDGVTWTALGSLEGYVFEGWNNVQLVTTPPGVTMLQPTTTIKELALAAAPGAALRPGNLRRLAASGSAELAGRPAFRYLRFSFAATVAAGGARACAGAEVRFTGFALAAAGDACAANVTVAAAPSALLAGSAAAAAVVAVPAAAGVALVSRSAALTPLITALTPNNGSALGGDVVTLRGSGFPSSPANVSVVLNGMPCAVLSASPDTVTCRTGARTAVEPVSVAVTVDGAGRAVFDASAVFFRYLDRWSALTTWLNQEPPVAGDTVIVPAGQAILVDISPPRLFLVYVEGELVFDNADLAFNASYFVAMGGSISAGSEARPFVNKLTITLHGDRKEAVEIPQMGAKCLVAMSAGPAKPGKCGVAGSCGVASWYAANQPSTRAYSAASLDLHGAPRKRVWTTLAADALPGASSLALTEAVDWAAGERLFVTDNADPMANTEVVVVAGLADAGFTVLLAAPLALPHRSRVVSTAGWGAHRGIDERAEVGLLSRNIVVQGDEASADQLYGVHVAAMGLGAILRMENVELRRCGQSGVLGRYCSHFHELGFATNSYIRHNSIHSAFQRAVTVHATHFASVVGNAAYNVLGHTIFVEDGVERWNVIDANLVAVTQQCFMCGTSDSKASNFWTASPTNIWRHNRGAGTKHFGFWFELPGNPHGSSFTPNYCPVSMPLVEFFNNTFHGGSMGLRVYPRWQPTSKTCSAATADAQSQYFVNNTLVFNRLGTFHKHAGSLHHINGVWADNDGALSWLRLENVPLTTGDAHVVNGLFVCDSTSAAACGSNFGILAPQNEYWYVAGATFVNFGPSGSPLSGCNGCNSDDFYAQGAFTYNVSALAYVNSPVRVKWNAPFKDIFADDDGSLVGGGAPAGGWVVAPFAFNNWPECPFDTTGALSFGSVCDASVIVRKVQLDWVAPSTLAWKTLNVSSAAGWAPVPFRPRVEYAWTWPAVTARWYAHSWVAPFGAAAPLPDWQRLRLTWSDAPHLEAGPRGDWLGTTWSWLQYRYQNAVTYAGVPQSSGLLAGGVGVPALPAGAAPTAASAIGTGSLPANNSWAAVLSLVNATAADPAVRYSFSAFSVQCAPAGCPVPPSMDVGSAVLWSDPATWPSGAVPAAGEDVLINATTFVMLDVCTPVLGTVTVQGKLAFLDAGVPLCLQARGVVVWGELDVGTAAAPFVTTTADIVLYGEPSSNPVIVSDNLFLGNKVLAVLGRLSLVGRPRAPVLTRLNATAAAGATTIQLAQSVQGAWLPGDVIALSATGYAWGTYETATVAAVADATVTLAAPLAYAHFAGAVAPGAPPLRAAVALLSRNVVVRSGLASNTSTYGATVFVGALKAAVDNLGGVAGSGGPAAGQSVVGSVDLRYVQFAQAGKAGFETPALTLQYGKFLFAVAPATTAPVNYLEGVAFSDCFAGGISAVSAPNLVLNATVVHHAVGAALSLDSTSQNATVVGCAFIGVEKPLNVNAPGQTLWHQPQAAVVVNTWAAALRGNVVSGAVDIGFSYRVPACTRAPAAYAGNEAHGVRIGVQLLPTATAGSCVRLDGFTVWLAAHIGVLTVDQLSTVRVDGLLAADNHIGVSLNYFGSGGVSDATPSTGTLTNSIILGTTAASNASCASNSVCRAVGRSDLLGVGCNSVLGAAYRRVGVLLPQYFAWAKTCDVNSELAVCEPPHSMVTRLCDLPLEMRAGVIGKVHAELRIADTTFGYFAPTDCGARSVAIRHSPGAVDASTPVSAARITWLATPAAARFDFSTNAITDAVCTAGKGCDGVNFAFALDTDGTLLGGAPNATVMGPNPLAAVGSPACVAVPAWTGIHCDGSTTFRKAVLVGADVGTIRMGLLEYTNRLGGNAANTSWRTTQSFGSFFEPCSHQMPQAIFAHLITPGVDGDVFFPSTEPGQLMYTYFNDAATEAGTVISVSLQRPFSWQVFVGGAPAPDLSALSAVRLPRQSDAAGTFLNAPQQRRLHFVVRPGVRFYALVRQPTLRLNFNLAISVEQFVGPALINALAILLGIQPGQIKVVDVQAGSVFATLQIADAQPTVYNPDASAEPSAALVAAATAQVERLLALAASVSALAASGALTSVAGYPVAGLSMTLPVSSLVNASSALGAGDTVAVNTNPPAAAPVPLSAGAIVGIAVGALVAVALVAGGVLLQRRRRQERARRHLTAAPADALPAAAPALASAAAAKRLSAGDEVWAADSGQMAFVADNSAKNNSALRTHGAGAAAAAMSRIHSTRRRDWLPAVAPNRGVGTPPPPPLPPPEEDGGAAADDNDNGDDGAAAAAVSPDGASRHAAARRAASAVLLRAPSASAIAVAPLAPPPPPPPPPPEEGEDVSSKEWL